MGLESLAQGIHEQSQLSLDTQALDKYFGTSMTVDSTQDPSLEGGPSCDQALEDEDRGANR